LKRQKVLKGMKAVKYAGSADNVPLGSLMHQIAVHKMKLRKANVRWRRQWVVHMRQVLSWCTVFGLTTFCLFNAFIFALAFGDTQTNTMIMSWLMGYGTTAVIVEPAQIIFLAMTPYLFSDEHACGRCMLRIQFVYNELFAP